jgi:hypothetical protein
VSEHRSYVSLISPTPLMLVVALGDALIVTELAAHGNRIPPVCRR